MNHRNSLPPANAKSISTGVVLAMLLLGLAACQPKAVRQTPSSTPTATRSPDPSSVDTTGAVRYRVDSAASKVHILAYRGGAMARLGHNHVVSSKEVAGTLWLHNDLARSRIDIMLPVASLIVDDPQSRALEGAEFTAEVAQDAREGTRRNLLRPEVLDVERFPTITLQSVAVAGTRSTPSLLMRVTVKGVSRDIVTLATLEEKAGAVTAEGEFEIQQTDFGMTPFSVARGALQVQDTLKIRFSIVCRQQQ